jgi:predicted GTPase
VDYGAILERAEGEGDVIIWDGGNNDLPFVRPDLEIVLTDPLRPGHETGWWPGEVNVRRADVVVVNKANAAADADTAAIVKCVRAINPGVKIIKTDSVLDAGPGAGDKLRGRKALVIEDGPTLTHGGMATGAGHSAAVEHGAVPVDVRAFAVGTIRDTLVKYPQAREVLPAMGYSAEQMADLAETIRKAPVDVVVVATPVDLTRLVEIDRPVVRVSYEVRDREEDGLAGRIRGFLERLR